MGVQLESLSQSSFEQHGPWHLHDSRFQQAQRVDLSTALLQAAAIPVLNERLGELSRASKSLRQASSPSTGEPSVVRKPSKESLSQPLASASSSIHVPPPPSPALAPPPATISGCKLTPTSTAVPAPQSALSFVRSIITGQEVLTFPLRELPPPPRPQLKRRRPDTDVDGFNTASSASKKRRLLRQLVTSRLSNPFSYPATHVLAREGVAGADKRFLKLAAIVSARRAQSQTPPPQNPSQSSSMRRIAAYNSFRLRARTDAVERCGSEMSDILVDAVSVQQTRGASAAADAQYPGTGSESLQTVPPLTPVLRIPPQHPQHSLSPISRVRAQARASPPGSPAGLRPTEPSGPTRRLSPSPRLRPLRSPELRTTRPLIDLDDMDDLDDESVAFPTSEYESRYGDESDDVYADFGVIFGGDGESSDDEGAGEHFEDYLDDVDGIPWNARC